MLGVALPTLCCHFWGTNVNSTTHKKYIHKKGRKKRKDERRRTLAVQGRKNKVSKQENGTNKEE